MADGTGLSIEGYVRFWCIKGWVIQIGAIEWGDRSGRMRSGKYAGTGSVLRGIPTRSVGTISVISSTPIMPMLVPSVIPESWCEHGVCIQSVTFVLPTVLRVLRACV